MRTHREQFTEMLNVKYRRFSNGAPATLGCLLTFADMLDERATDQFRGATKVEPAGEAPRVKHANGYDLFMAIRKALVSLEFEIKQPGSVHWGTVEAMLDDAIFVDGPTTNNPPTSLGNFNDALVERLARLGLIEYNRTLRDNSPWCAVDDWEDMSPIEDEGRKAGIRAILAELASMPCELPTSEPIERILNECDAPHRSTNLTKSRVLAEWTRNAVAPVLAAKDASLTHYRKSFEAKQARVAEMETMANESAQQYAQALTRIAGLESRAPANECSNAEREQYETTIELQKQRIAELETRWESSEMIRGAQRRNVQKLWDFLREHDDQLFTTWNPTWDLLSRVKTRVAELEKRLAEVETRRIEYLGKNHQQPGDLRMALDRMFALEKRVTELTAPVVVDGKTPGQVNHAAFAHSVENHHESKGVPNWEIAARAVLRAFGNGAKTKEALEKVRVAVDKAQSFDVTNDEGNNDYAVLEDDVFKIIDAEIANIEGVKA